MLAVRVLVSSRFLLCLRLQWALLCLCGLKSVLCGVLRVCFGSPCTNETAKRCSLHASWFLPPFRVAQSIIDASRTRTLGKPPPREALCVVAKGSESAVDHSLKLLDISPFVLAKSAAALAAERQRWRHAVARRLRNLGEPRRERFHEQLSQLAARAFSAGGRRPIHERLAEGRPNTRFRVRGGGSGTREQRE